MKFAGILSVVAVLVCTSSTVHGFLPKLLAGGGAAATSSLADEAIAVFNEKYPFGREPLKPSQFMSVGMPGADLDGTKYKVAKAGEARGKRLTDISEKDARASFAELAKLYGPESALAMTKKKPVCLALARKDFAPSLKNYIDIFGDEEAKAMVCRNPGLLAIRPSEAARATDSTMQASYLISATGPYGDVILPTLLALLLVPALESVSGVPIRATLFSVISGGAGPY